MDKNTDPAYSRNVVEFVAVANEYCKYAEHAGEIKGDEMLRILQRILPLLYLKASLLPSLEPVFEDGNEKFVSEPDWKRINNMFREKFGSADLFQDLHEDRQNEPDTIISSGIAENMADIYQDLKDFLLLYQTGTREVMNDAVWECRINFENIWGQKLVNSLREIHRFIYSGGEIEKAEPDEDGDDETRDTSGWIISKRQKEIRGDDKE